MEFTPEQKKTAVIATAAALGVGQVIILKEMVDPKIPSLPFLSQFGSFAKPSAAVGISGGICAIAIALFMLTDYPYKHAFTAYGGASLVSGLLSGLDMLKV
jgi:hypothetical protein